MLAIRTRFVMIGFLLLGILLGLFFGYKGGVIIKTNLKEMKLKSEEDYEYRSAVRSITVTVQPNEKDLLFDQLHQFAKKNFFAFEITKRLPPSSSYTIDMWREDIHIGGSFYPDSGELGLAFFRNHFEQRPTEPIPLTVFDDLISDFLSFISNVPSSTIIEIRQSLIITTNKNWRNEELLIPMKAVADKHSLKYEYSFYDDDRCVEVELHGEGFYITTNDCEQDTIENITIDFFLDYHETPTAVSEETLDILFVELRELFDGSNNATVNEEP